MSKRILITGGAGFVGSHMADALLEAGHEVRVFDNLTPQVLPEGWPEYLSPDVEMMTGDMRDPDAVEREFDGVGYGAFKQAVADAVITYLAPVREGYHALRGDETELERILEAGADKARAIAVDTVDDVRRAMGVGPVRPRG